jgi:hypothetical protein
MTELHPSDFPLLRANFRKMPAPAWKSRWLPAAESEAAAGFPSRPDSDRPAVRN